MSRKKKSLAFLVIGILLLADYLYRYLNNSSLLTPDS